MKKTVVVLLTLTLIFWGVDKIVKAQQPAKQGNFVVYLDPVPIGSDPTQTTNPLSTPASFIKTFKHPKQFVQTKNFSTNEVDVGGRTYQVSDLAAVPGNKPVNNRTALVDMFDAMFPHPSMSLIHGFDQPFIEDPQTKVRQYSDYNVAAIGAGDNFSSHQLQIADIKNYLAAPPNDEFSNLFKTAPRVQGVIGSSQENISPYSSSSYPSLIVGKTSAPGELDSLLGISEPFINAVSYDVALVNSDQGVLEGLTTAVYDTISVLVDRQVRYEDPNNPNMPIINPLGKSAIHYESPISFFRTGTQEMSSRVLMTGYNNNMDMPILESSMILSLAFHFPAGNNPIAIKSINILDDKTQGTVDNGTDLAVLNQATLFDLDQTIIDISTIGPMVFSDGKNHELGELLGTYDGNKFVGLRRSTQKKQKLLPHPVVSYVSFLKQRRPWQHDVKVGSDTDRPSTVFGHPYLYAFVPFAYDAETVVDEVNNVKKEALVVPSAQRDCHRWDTPQRCDNGSFYLYKIDPANHPRLYGKDWQKLNFPPKELPFVVGDSFEFDEPVCEEGKPDKCGFAPYGITSADFDSDGCSDVVLTWRGKKTTVQKGNVKDFENKYGDLVKFESNDTRNFANFISIFFGTKSGTECIFKDDQQNRKDIYFDKAVQIAAIETGDFDGNGSKDVIFGDSVKPNAYVLYYDSNRFAKANIVDKLNVSFSGFQNNFAGTGIAALAVDEIRGGGANFGAISNNQPLMLPPMGCRQDDNVEVTSMFEATRSFFFNMAAFGNNAFPPCYDVKLGKAIPCSCQELKPCTAQGLAHVWSHSLICKQVVPQPKVPPNPPIPQFPQAVKRGDLKGDFYQPEQPKIQNQLLRPMDEPKLQANQGGIPQMPESGFSISRPMIEKMVEKEKYDALINDANFLRKMDNFDYYFRNAMFAPKDFTDYMFVNYYNQMGLQLLGKDYFSKLGDLIKPLSEPKSQSGSLAQLPFKVGFRFPRGQTMSGPGEMTYILNSKNLNRKCTNTQGQLLPGFECNQDNDCTKSMGKQGYMCGIDCMCHPDCELDPASECGFGGKACAVGDICDLTCKCQKKGIEKASDLEPKCFARVQGFSSEEMARQYRDIMGKVSDVTGIKDYEFIGEPGASTVNLTCFFPTAGQMKASIDPSIVAQFNIKAPGEGKTLEKAVLQTGGIVLTTKKENFMRVKQNVLLSPLAKKGAPLTSLVLPNMNASTVPTALRSYVLFSDVDPDYFVSSSMTTGLMKGERAKIAVNEWFTIDSDVAAQKDTPQTGMGFSVISLSVNVPKFGTISHLLRDEEAQKMTEIFKSEYTLDEYIDALKGKMSKSAKQVSMTKETPEIYTGLGDNDYSFVQTTGQSKEPMVKSGAIKFMDPNLVGRGSGHCGCSINGRFDSASLISLIVIAGVLGIIGGRKKMRGMKSPNPLC